jgi:hypothetical protein
MPTTVSVVASLVAALWAEGVRGQAEATLRGAGDAWARHRRLQAQSEGYNFMFYFVIGAMMLTCLIYNIFFKHKMEVGFLRQNHLPETMLRQDVIARCVEHDAFVGK